MWKSLLGLGILAACFETAALPKAVCFRYDDNQTVEKYSVLAETFLKNNARFSMSLIPFSSPVESAEWRKMVCRLAGLGFEIMDHTPRHSTLSFSLGKDDPLLKKAMGAPFVHHITNNRVCLKYDMTGSVWSKPIAAEVRNGNIISPLPEFKLRRVIEIDGQYFYVVPGKFKLLSIWAEDNVRLQDGKKQVRMCLSSLVPYPGAAEFLVEVSREGFRRIGLEKMPVVWVQPGGYYPALETAGMSRVLKKYGYVSATTQPGILKGFGSPDIETRRFALDWGDFNFERQSVEEIKTRIADIVACRRVAIGSSHFRIKCSLAEYAAQHDQVLKWLKKNNIQVMTQSQIALLLKNTPIPAGKNIFPALDCDLDNNGRPDGYFATAGVKFQKSSKITLRMLLKM